MNGKILVGNGAGRWATLGVGGRPGGRWPTWQV